MQRHKRGGVGLMWLETAGGAEETVGVEPVEGRGAHGLELCCLQGEPWL